MNQHRRSVSEPFHDREQYETTWQSYRAATTDISIENTQEEPRSCSPSLHRQHQSEGHSRRNEPSNLSIIYENDSSEHIQPIPMTVSSSLGPSSPAIAGPSGGPGMRRAYSLGAKGQSVLHWHPRRQDDGISEDGTRSEAPSYHTTAVPRPTTTNVL